jgi:hypothetical protein
VGSLSELDRSIIKKYIEDICKTLNIHIIFGLTVELNASNKVEDLKEG